MKNWLIILFVFAVPLGLYGFLSHRVEAGMTQFTNPEQIQQTVEANKEKIVQGAALPKLYYFHSPLCGECKKQDKELAGLKNEFEGKIFFIELLVTGAEGDKQEIKNLIKKYKVNVTPTIVVTKADGDMIKKYDSLVKHGELEKLLKNVAVNEPDMPKCSATQEKE